MSYHSPPHNHTRLHLNSTLLYYNITTKLDSVHGTIVLGLYLNASITCRVRRDPSNTEYETNVCRAAIMFWLDYVASQHNEKDRTLTKESESSQRTTQVIHPSFSNFETAYLINKTKALNETDSKTCSWMRSCSLQLHIVTTHEFPS